MNEKYPVLHGSPLAMSLVISRLDLKQASVFGH